MANKLTKDKIILLVENFNNALLKIETQFDDIKNAPTPNLQVNNDPNYLLSKIEYDKYKTAVRKYTPNNPT